MTSAGRDLGGSGKKTDAQRVKGYVSKKLVDITMPQDRPDAAALKPAE